MKKTILALFIILTFSLMLFGCSGKEEETESSAEMFPEFQLKDLEGNEIDNEVFSESTVTLVNLWGTFCSPCIREMPELDKLYKEKKDDGLGVIGIVTDGNETVANEIIGALGISYSHLVPTEEFSKDYLFNFEYVPTTIFVNSKGEIVGETIVGARSYDEFKEIIEKLLKENKK